MEVDLDRSEDEKELGGIEGGKSVMRIFYVREESIFNKKNEKKYYHQVFYLKNTQWAFRCQHT